MTRIVINFPDRPFRAGQHLTRVALMALLVVALSGCAWLDGKLRKIVYRPTPEHQADFQGLRAGDRSFSTLVRAEQATAPWDHLQMWWLPHPDAQAPTLLYLHGTFRNLYRNLSKINALRDAGYAVLAVDYRGWGQSSPIIPSEQTINADAQVAWTELMRRQPDPRRRFIYGHSMGGGVAIELAQHLRHGRDYAGLIVESSFTSLPDVAAASGWLGRMLSGLSTQRFDSIRKIGQVDAPILIVHGSADKTVPISLGRRLQQAAPAGTLMVEIPGGSHSRLQSDSPDIYRQALRQFAADLKAAAAPGPGSSVR